MVDIWWVTLICCICTSGLVLNDMNVKVYALADKWLETVILHEKSDSTYRAFKTDMKVHILPMYGHLKISQITKSLVSDLRSILSKKQLSKSSINRIMASFKSFIRYCIDHGHIIKNPFIGYKELRVQSSQKEFWEKSDIEIFVKNAKKDFYYDLYIFALNTGIRIGEIGALNIEKINFERKTILIDQSLNKKGISTVKNYEIRNVYMNDVVLDIVKRNSQNKEPNEPLFKTVEGKRIYSSSFSVRYFTPLQRKLKLDNMISFHGLRHTFASHFLMNGGSIFDLQKLLGHKSINSTMVYMRI